MRTHNIRSLLLPLGLAALAAILIGFYIASYRKSVDYGAGMVKVLVASRDIPAGTSGSSVAGGGYLKTQTMPRRALVPGHVTSAVPLTSLVSASTIYKGEQVSVRQFKPAARGGIFAKFSGTERVVVVPGEPNQLLAGTLAAGNRVDVVANAKYHIGSLSRATTRTVLRDLLVVQAPEAPKSGGITSVETATATLAMTDKESQTMLWALKNASWYLVLRPTAHPKNSPGTVETLNSFLSQGLPASQAPGVIAGNFPESVDGQ